MDIQQISNLQFQSIEENQVLDLLPASCKDDADEVMACINEFKSKQGINNALVKQFGNKKRQRNLPGYQRVVEELNFF